MSAVRQSQTVLPQQLAVLPHHVSLSAQKQGQQDVQGRARITLQAALVRNNEL